MHNDIPALKAGIFVLSYIRGPRGGRWYPKKCTNVENKNRTKKTIKSSFAISTEITATPENPSNPAIKDKIKKANIIGNMFFPFKK